MTIYQALHAFQILTSLLTIFLCILIHAYKNNVKKYENLKNDFSILEATIDDLRDRLKEKESKTDTH